jgi:hypothetical protein
MDWPPSTDFLQLLLGSPESTLLERKREWYDFASKSGKAEFAKDVLAMANATREGLYGYIIFGVEDVRVGGAVVGVETQPSSEQIQLILTSYTNPVPEVQCADVRFGSMTLSVLRIVWTNSHPYYAVRDHSGTLDSRSVYMRRGDTIVHLRPHEVEALIRGKAARVGSAQADVPLKVGFVESGADFSSRVIVRVINVTDETIFGVTILWDVRLAAQPGSLARRRSRTDYPMKPGEVVEAEIDPRKQWFWYGGKSYSADNATTIDRWFDVAVYVQYRDRDGFIQELRRSTTLTD